MRLSYTKNSTTNTLEILDRNDYYPFGMNFVAAGAGAVYDPKGSPLNYKFGTKELQETGFYDFGARMLMPDVGRWFTVDPLAEKNRKFTPYHYAANNPIRNIDPDGRSEQVFTGESAVAVFTYIRDAHDKRNANNAQKPPDDIFLDKNGKVSTIFRNNKPNRFYDASNGNKELFFNDPNGVDKFAANKEYNIDDQVFHQIDYLEYLKAIASVGSNTKIMSLLAKGRTGGFMAPALLTSAYALIGYESTQGEADFSAHYLTRKLGLEGTNVNQNDAFYHFRFGNANIMYSLMDSGNFMWGGWSKLIGLTDAEVRGGVNLYEKVYNGTSDTDADADERAIFNGRK